VTAAIHPLPIGGADVFKEECQSLYEWISSIEMPEDRVGIREAGGNVCGILIGMFTESKACFYVEESANIVSLCPQLKDLTGIKSHVLILDAILACARQTMDSGGDMNFEFR